MTAQVHKGNGKFQIFVNALLQNPGRGYDSTVKGYGYHPKSQWKI
jgi:hypothetical protein